MDEYDVVIVGGGPAGTSAACAAARAGASAAVLEKEGQIARTVRTSGVTWISDARELGIPQGLYNPVKKYRFCSPNVEASVEDAEPRAAVLDVRGTYRWLAGQARDAGAKILEGHAATDARRLPDGRIAVSCSSPDGQKEFAGAVTIDATGFPTAVAGRLGHAKQWSRFGAGAEYEAHAEGAEDDAWWLMVGSAYSPSGYAWIFPLGGKMVRIGVGVGKPESGADPRALLERLLRDRPGPLGRIGRITPVEFHYGLIPNEGLARKSAHDGLILAGDSAGQANPLVLEGIRYAIRFGRMAGRAAASAALAGDASARALGAYEKEWRRLSESKISAAYRVQKRWAGLSDAEWDRELGIIGELSADELVDFIRADFGISGAAKLAARHPRLAIRQLFNMAKR